MTRPHIILCLPAIVFLMIAAGCASPSAERQLQTAESLLDTRPDSALVMLGSIDGARLHGEQRARHALLSVKATDRAYLPHQSDSTVMVAHDYYSNREAGLRTAETYYYTGRVYADLDDYPRALKGFLQALRTIEEIPETTTQVLRFKSAIVSQQAQLLRHLRLYSESKPFFREAVRIGSILSDTINLIYDLHDYAFVLMEQSKGDSARTILTRATPFKRALTPSLKSEFHTLLALSYLKDNQYDKAAELTDSINPYANPDDNSLELSVLTRIYENMGCIDSAAHYARLLRDKPKYTINKFTAHRILAHNSLRSGNIDTIAAYHDSLARFSVDIVNWHDLGLNLPGTMFYRLMATELDNSRLQSRNSTLTFSLLILGLICAGCVIVILAILYRRSYRRQKEDETVSQLQQILLTHATAPIINVPKLSESTDARERLIATLRLRMEMLADQPYELPESLSGSTVVSRLKGMGADKDILPPDSPLWDDLEAVVLEVSPQFNADIQLLLGNTSLNDYHTSLLIKAGLTPTEIAGLLNRSKGTISNNRKRMCERIFGQKFSNTLFDNIIRSL